jgi:hypothetical protein
LKRNNGEFSCLGFNTSGPLRFVGGKNKEHPNEEDLDNARKFALGLRNGFKFAEIQGSKKYELAVSTVSH